MATRPYQGYPYSNPHVNDAPTVDAATANRWTNLPRRPVLPPTPSTNKNVQQIYVDIPDEEGSHVSQPKDSPHPSLKSATPDEPAPVIYIDVPEAGDSDVAGPASLEPEHPEYEQETIFYDPFENRRIDRQKAETPDSESGAGSSTRPAPPNTLDVGAPGSSGYGSGSTFSPSLPSYLSKETSIYGSQSDDGFSLSPLPVSPYPEPPPAYTEVDERSQPTPATPVTPSTATSEPPRTVVITPGMNPSPATDTSSIGLPSPDRKVVYCQHCGLKVHTLVIWENGTITHAIAILLMIFFLWPLVILVYCCSFYKYKNHYCPNCNKKIGYEMPGLCISMNYSKAGT